MDLLLILTYTAICVAIFKIFRIPLNKWTVPTAVLGGVVLIGALIFLMNYNHPYSEVARSYYVSVPIIPTVTGKVIEVPVKGNEPLKTGDVLFRIDPEPFQNRLKSLKAQQISARADLFRINELIKRNFGTQREQDAAQARVEDGVGAPARLQGVCVDARLRWRGDRQFLAALAHARSASMEPLAVTVLDVRGALLGFTHQRKVTFVERTHGRNQGNQPV